MVRSILAKIAFALPLLLAIPAVAQTVVTPRPAQLTAGEIAQGHRNLTEEEVANMTDEQLAEAVKKGELTVIPDPALAPAPEVAGAIHAFSFGPIPVTNTSGSAEFTLIDGNQPDCGIGYCGIIQIRWDGGSNPWWGMEAPNGPYLNPDGTPCAVGSAGICEWGFPNGGFNLNNTVTPEPSPLVWDNPGCGSQVPGCTGHNDTTVPFINYAQGVVASVHDTFVVHHHASCGRGGCHAWNTTDENGGTGTATYTPQ